jgi:hypothetical protein
MKLKFLESGPAIVVIGSFFIVLLVALRVLVAVGAFQ